MDCTMQYLSATVFAILVIFAVRTDAHGRLVEPPSRSSMWRYGFHTPINYNDNQLFCGGYDVQWNKNGGKCGICGDPYNGRRDNEAGGQYATGTIARHYTEGQTITVTLDITTNHGGYFEFRICPNNNPSRPATESCLNRYLLRQPNGDTKWRLPTGTHNFSLNLVLPHGLTCTQCVMQWKWNTASNWDCDVNNNCCKGCGPQEQFLGCADVAIASSSQAVYSNTGFMGSSVNVINGPSGSNLVVPGGARPGFIPIDSIGAPMTNQKCEATAIWKTKYAYADRWCQAQCPVGNCPVQYCQAGCRLR